MGGVAPPAPPFLTPVQVNVDVEQERRQDVDVFRENVDANVNVSAKSVTAALHW